MTIKTRDFGSIELDENAVLDFCAPIFGFEELQRYVLLSDEEMGAGIFWLQAVEEQNTCFILLDPHSLGLEYCPKIPEDEQKSLDVLDEPVFRLIATVPEDFKKTTVNLKSPIVINPEKRRAAQVILEADYPIRMPVFGTGEN